MAIKNQSGFTLSATGTAELPNGQSFSMNRVVLHLVVTATASVTIKGRAQGTSAAFVAIPYKPRYLNGSVSDEIPVGTAITSTSIIDVDVSGLDLQLDATISGGGSVVVYYSKLKG